MGLFFKKKKIVCYCTECKYNEGDNKCTQKKLSLSPYGQCNKKLVVDNEYEDYPFKTEWHDPF